MAMIFELVINAGPNRTSAERVAECLSGVPRLHAGRYRVSLIPPQNRAVRGEDGAVYHEVTVMAAGVGHARTSDVDRELPLDVEELSELAQGLYEVLRRCRGYRAAVVGWNPEYLVDTAELARDWVEELRAGTCHGLVLADETLEQLVPSARLEPFAPGFSWIPYRYHRWGAPAVADRRRSTASAVGGEVSPGRAERHKRMS